MPNNHHVKLLGLNTVKNYWSVLWNIAFILPLLFLLGCEQKVIKFTISSKNGEMNFAVPEEMIDKCCLPMKAGDDGVIIYLSKASHVENWRYSVTFFKYWSIKTAIEKTLPDRVEAADEVASEFDGYKKYVENKRPQDPFLLVGNVKSGEKVFLQCHHGRNLISGCRYYGIYNEKLGYEFSFPGTQIGELENLISYANNEISRIIVEE